MVEGEHWNQVDAEKVITKELLQEDKLNELVFNAEEIELPAIPGMCYLGKGVQFEYNGKKYDVSDAATLQEALKSDGIKWYWNKDRFRKYGGTTTATLDVYVVDKTGQAIPDCHLTLTKNV